jgi:hypothetical protein
VNGTSRDQAQDTLRRIIRRGVDSGESHASAADLYPQLLISLALLGSIWNLPFQEVAPIDMQKYAESRIAFLLRALRG